MIGLVMVAPRFGDHGLSLLEGTLWTAGLLTHMTSANAICYAGCTVGSRKKIAVANRTPYMDQETSQPGTRSTGLSRLPGPIVHP